MKKIELIQQLDSYLSDNAEVIVAENPRCLMGIEHNITIMIKLDGDWDYSKKELEK